MQKEWQKRAFKRFHALAVKEALGLISPADLAKLERYSALVRKIEGGFYSSPRQAMREWQDKIFLKYARERFSGGSKERAKPPA